VRTATQGLPCPGVFVDITAPPFWRGHTTVTQLTRCDSRPHLAHGRRLRSRRQPCRGYRLHCGHRVPAGLRPTLRTHCRPPPSLMSRWRNSTSELSGLLRHLAGAAHEIEACGARTRWRRACVRFARVGPPR
jgi:hypothetical protein